MLPDDLIRVTHMLEAARKALSFVVGKERSDLDHDDMLAFALIKALEIIGEAAVNMSDEFRKSHPEIPWTKIAGMRHRLVHAYFDVNFDILWLAMRDDLPPLTNVLERIIESNRH
jgi:uncharacterized protein with HEPN domain